MNESDLGSDSEGQESARENDRESLAQVVEAIHVDQRQRWLAGEKVLVEKYLQDHPVLQSHREYAFELIYREFLLRKELGEAPPVEEYSRRFPRHASRLRVQIELQEAIDSDPLPQLTQSTSVSSTSSHCQLPGGDQPAPVRGFEILGVLGRGGMGVVYKAKQLGLNRLVALKMIRAGEHADPERLERFYAEARAAARLQHPHIVQIYEVGEQDGRPYFAMELVDGGNVAQHWNGTPQPSQAAAELVRTLAEAVHYAHEHGIVHRDLKPANILLSGEWGVGSGEYKAGKHDGCSERSGTQGVAKGDGAGGPRLPDHAGLSEGGAVRRPTPHSPFPNPKITDFGLAKQLDSSSGQTHSGAIVGTPSYMAPEQAAGKVHEIGPAADVYALGSILYEALTGRPPFKAETPLDTLQQVLNSEPLSPSRLQPKIHRDLETICLKCLEKEPPKRYTSARDLADELGRHLRNEPIQARPISSFGRVSRWCWRNPALAAASGLAAAALLIAAGISLAFGVYQYRSAASLSEQRDLAQENLQLANANFDLARKAVDEYYTVATKEPLLQKENMRNVRKLILEKALPLYRGFRAQRRDDADIEASLAANYFRVGSITAEIGRKTDAIEAYQQALLIREKLVAAHPDAIQLRNELASTYNNLGNMQNEVGQREAAGKSYEQARQIQEQLVATQPEVDEYRFNLARTYNNLGRVQFHTHQPRAAADSYERARQIQEKLVAAQPRENEYAFELARTYNNVGLLQRETAQPAEAIKSFEQAIKIQEKLVALEPEVTEYQFELARTYHNVGILHFLNGRPAPAGKFYEQARRMRETLVALQPEVTAYQYNLAVTYSDIGLFQKSTGDPAAAVKSYERGLTRFAPFAKKHPGDQALRNTLIGLRSGLAGALAYLGKHERAATEAAKIVEEKSLGATNLYNLACALSVASAAARNDQKLSSSERDRLADQYAAQAVSTLNQADAAGFFAMRTPLEWMKKDKDLDTLRSRADYKKLLTEIEARWEPAGK
jgi:serine/threonine protein kinase/tetratricopeptide (TPR) repeat protein